jgi:MFS family permease
MLADYFRRAGLARAISVFLGSGFVGSGLAFIAGGWLLGRLQQFDSVTLPLVGAVHPWQAAFLLAATPGLLCFVLMLTVREPMRRGLSAATRDETPPFGEVLKFLWTRRRTIGAIYIGFSLLAATQFGLGAWTPTLFMRTFSWDAKHIGYAYGLYYMTLGTGGVLAGGWLADRIARSGRTDANLVTGLVGAACALPFVIAFPLVSNGNAALALLAPATFFGTMPFGAGTAALPLLAPNRMRGQVVALYLLVANVLGQAVGPTCIAALTDYVFHDPMKLRWSVAIACGSLLALAILVIASGLKHVGAAIAQGHSPPAPSDAMSMT